MDLQGRCMSIENDEKEKIKEIKKLKMIELEIDEYFEKRKIQ